MISFDPSQLRSLALDPTRHARVLGAPGTGKTTVLLEACTRTLALPEWGEDDVLVLAPNRLVAAALRADVERGVGRAFGGTPVRTAASLAFAVLARAAALEGAGAPRLLTGTVQDEAIAEVVTAGVAASGAGIAGLPPEVLQSPAFRAELRELWRVADDFGIAPAALRSEAAALAAEAATEAHARVPDPELLARWRDGFGLIQAVADRLADERPDELSSSGLLREAATAVRRVGAAGETDRLAIPRLILVDDAQELGEGELALLAACAESGSRIWVFGDPDVATGAFHGERTLVLARLDEELARRSAPVPQGTPREPAQLVVLERAHRHGPGMRDAIRGLAARVGAAGAGEQRAALPRAAAPEDPEAPVQFAVVGSSAEQLGAIAHRLRARRLGLGAAAPVSWDDMAVLCRSRGEAVRVARVLAAHQVPTGIAAGGIVLREHQVVRELIRLLQHALGLQPLTPAELLSLAGGVIGGLDPVALRRLRGALLLQERRASRAAGREARSIEAVVAEAFAEPGPLPIVDSAGGRAVRRLGMLAGAGVRVHEAGGTPREVLWALWEGTKLAASWQNDALDGRGARSDEAHRALDAVVALFFALQRHEEQDSAQPIAELLTDLLSSAVPEDSLAQRSQRAAVTVTTPQGALGREFAVVAVVGLQDGSWPNLRARGSLLGAAALERWLRGGEAVAPSRKDTMHDELRLLVHACARASRELLVVAVADEDQHPSSLFGLGREYRRDELPSSRLTLRGVTAAMRRRLAADPDDRGALRALRELVGAGAAGAHPDEWYGVLPPSTTAPLVPLEEDPEATVSVSPSQLDQAESCPLDWVIARLGGSVGSVQASLGTLVHHAFETAQRPDADEMLAAIMTEWRKLEFDAEWESVRAEQRATQMTGGLAAYLREFAASERQLIGKEAGFAVPIDRAVLRGIADRLERRELADGTAEVTVLDLKTGRSAPSKVAAETHAQLRAYQLGVVLGAFDLAAADGANSADGTNGADRANGADGANGTDGAAAVERADATAAHTIETRSGGARLLYVHPDATGSAEFVERVQQPIDAAAIQEMEERVANIARVMAGGDFTARVEHHCSDPHQPGNCRLHIIPAVSHG